MTDLTTILSESLGGVSLAEILKSILTLLICLVIVRVVMKLVRKVVEKSSLDDRVQKYIAAGVKFVLYLLTAIIVIGSLGIDMTSLVALLSVASLGITLAAEDILANLAGGLVILSSHPFQIGDFIEVDGVSGTVEEIALNHTKLITADGLLVLLPNKTLADSQLTNYTALGRRRITHVITASYDTPTETVKEACYYAISQTPNILEDPAPVVYVTKYGENAVEYTVYCWSNVDTFGNTKFGLGENLRPAFAKYNVKMTYNHLNVHIVGNN